jgi:hypothetical protein
VERLAGQVSRPPNSTDNDILHFTWTFSLSNQAIIRFI